MFEDNQELINEFVIESREGLAEVESDLLTIEASGENVDDDLVNKVFRAVHSIKGAAGFMGLATIGELSHCLENVLAMVRNRELVATPSRVGVMLEAADVLRSLIEDIANSESIDISANTQQLNQIAAGEDTEPGTPGPTTPAEASTNDIESTDAESPAACSSMEVEQEVSIPTCAISDIPFDVDEKAVATAVNDGQHVYVMEFDLIGDSEFSGNTVDWCFRLGDVGDVLSGWIDRSALPGIDAEIPGSLPCLVIVASVLTPSVFLRFWRLPESSIHEVSLDATGREFTRRIPAPERTMEAQPIEFQETAAASCEPSAPAQGEPAPTSDATSDSAPSADTAASDAPTSTEIVAIQTPDVSASAFAVAGEPSGPQPATAGKTAPRGPETPVSKPETNIRVSVSVLDRLMNLAGELVLGRNQLLQTIAADDAQTLELVATRIDQVTSELQETIMQTRMQPVGSVFNKFTRIVRDLSRMLDKKCQLEIEGKDVELDKTIIEAISDPLTHLVRNSVDHGVERPELRVANGKSETGHVHLTAYHQDGKVNISISDDGAGIDASILRRKAVEKGLLTQERADSLSDAEAVRLIFMPGFSTADEVSAVSGRGVGMDVVKTNFERLGGSVDIDTVLGKGTTITVRLPLTLAIIPSLIVRSGEQRFALPQVNISELVRIRVGDETRRIEKLRDAEVLRLRDSLLPLVRLSSFLNTNDGPTDGPSPVDTTALTKESTTDRQSATNIVVLEAGNLRYGLVVDGLNDSEEIVVKPLGRHMKSIKSLAGATVLGDGQIALILDVTGLANHMQLQITERLETAADNQELEENDETISTLLFTNHPDEQFGIPMNCVARIERIRIDQLDAVGGQEVLQYRDRTLPLLLVDKCLAALPAEEQDRLYVVVFRAGDREVGLVAPDILDIRDISSNLDTSTFAEAGLLGSLVLDGHTTRIVDAYELARSQHPEWFLKKRPAAQSETTGAPGTGRQSSIPKILLAEDSSFFRNKVKQFLEQLGTEVVTAEDGDVAWKILESGHHDFTLVVTDIEMPNLNGFELCQRIRASEQLRTMPVLALTSLASDENIAQGRKAGVDEYLIKLDRDKLALAVTAQLNRHVSAAYQSESMSSV